jgi:predicted GH43/DUF377 family glycosyl hydrolase
MNWIKKGLIIDKFKLLEFGIYMPQVPYAIPFNDRIRIYFGARNGVVGGAAIYFIDIDGRDPSKILQFSMQPVLEKGEPGFFDQDGILPVCVRKVDDKIFLYYGGFTKSINHPHFCMMGLAISNDDGITFNRYSNGPIIPISDVDPCLIGSADIYEKDGMLHMVYTSGVKWVKVKENLEVLYSLKHSFSEDGIHWECNSRYILEDSPEDFALAKPSIFKIDRTYFMAFSKRSISDYRNNAAGTYRIQFAQSNDLINWSITNEIEGLDISSTGWDSEMVCYPSVIEFEDKIYMFYNGNNFGESGIGYAELKKY